MSNVPKLRFPEFEGEWEVNELGKFLVKFDKKVTRKNGYSILTSSRAGLFLQNAYFKQEVISKDNALYRVLPKGYFTYRYMSDDSFFRININELGFDGLVSQEYPVFTTNEELNKVFLKEHLYGSKAFYAFCAMQKRGGTRTRLYFDTLKKYRIIMPTLPEQTKIADFFTLIDKKITKQDEKVAALEQYKKGLMQKIFAREIRFKDDGGKYYPEWEVKSFTELFQTMSTKRHQVASSDYLEEGLYEIIDQGKDSIAGFSIDETKVFIDIPVIIYGDHTTIVKYRMKPFIVGADGTKLLKEKTGNLLYLYYALTYYNIVAEGYKRHFSILQKIKLPYPNLPEQTKIANFLSLYDRKIEKEKAKLEALKVQKKGLLQQMFV